MRIVIVPSTGWHLDSSTVASRIAEAWHAVAPRDTITPVVLHDGGRGFAQPLATEGTEWPRAADVAATASVDTLFIDGAQTIADLGERSARGLIPDVDGLAEQGSQGTPGGGSRLLDGSSYELGVLLARAWEGPERRIVLGLAEHQDQVPWADGGAGLLAGLADTFADSDTAGNEDSSLPIAVTAQGGLPDLVALRARLATKQFVVATRSTAPLLGLGGLAASLNDAGLLGSESAHGLERSLGDFAHEVAGAWGESMVGQNLLAGRSAGRPAADVIAGVPSAGGTHVVDGRAVSARARELTARPGVAAGGGAAFILSVLGAQVLPGLEVSAERERLDDALAHADAILVVSPVLDAIEMHDGATTLVSARALALGIPVLVLTGDTHAGRREWAAIGVSAMFHPAPGLQVSSPAPTAPTGPSSSRGHSSTTKLPARVAPRNDDELDVERLLLDGLAARTAGIARTWSR